MSRVLNAASCDTFDKWPGCEDIKRGRSGKVIHKNMSEVGSDKGRWMELEQNFFKGGLWYV